MRAQARALGHAIHPMLIVFPLGLLTTAVIFDIVYMATDRDGFAAAAAYAIAVGVIGGLIAAVFGLVDWLAIPRDTRARRVGLWHGLGNALVLALFTGSWLRRLDATDWNPDALAVGLAIAGVLVGAITGWLGGELVERLGISVEPDAGLDAPSSLSPDRQHATGGRARHTA